MVGIASRKMSDGLTELLGQENLGKGVEVKISEVYVYCRLYIIVQYSAKIHGLQITSSKK